MEFHEWARTFGSIGTALSAIIAVVTYIKATKKSLHAAEAEKALHIRQQLQSLAAEIQKLQTVVHEGTVLMGACAAVVHEIEARLSGVTTKEEIEEVLSNDPLLLSFSITGWQKSKAGVEVSERITRIKLDATQLTGELRILNEIVELLAAVINDGCSPFFLHEILVARQKLDEVRFDQRSDQPMRHLIDQIIITLQHQATAYFFARYGKALEATRQFIETLVIALCALPDRQLVAVAESSTNHRVEEATKTGSIRRRLQALEGAFGSEDWNALNTLIDNIKTYVDKNYAINELHRLTKH